MMRDLNKRVELLANTAIIVVAIMLSIVLVRNYLLTNTASQRINRVVNNQATAGTRISLPDVDWAKNGQTLLLAVSSTCHYCSESAPFYQRLVQEKGNTQIVAVLPQAISEGQEYLSKLNVSVNGIKQAPLSSVGVNATPTLLLVDNKGTLINAWVGKLPPAQEAEVLNKLQSSISKQ